MASTTGPLANGQLPIVQDVLYRCPDNVRWIVVDFQNYVNSNLSSVTVNIYKRKRNQTARLLSPKDLELGAGFRLDYGDESHKLTPGDTIEGVASNTGVDFIIDGITTSS
jgi:hypothetical protein